MARSRDRGVPPREEEPRRFDPEEATRATALLGKRISELEATNPAKVRFDAPEVTTLEDAVRATVRDVFGSTSEEARQHGSFKFARQGWASAVQPTGAK